MNQTARLYAVTESVREDEPASLLMPHESAYVTETATGLTFRADTPLEVVGPLIERLTRQHKRIEWAIGDAINFGETNYPGMYEQWVEQTGLSENTLSTMRWVADRIDPLRRREDVGWSHHREVAPLEPKKQDELLSRAAEKGMTRFELRQAVKSEAEKIRGRSVDADGEAIEAAEPPWVPGLEDLADDARQALMARAPLGRRRNDWLAGAIFTLVWLEQRDCFKDWRL
jgi:hypothetical protein